MRKSALIIGSFTKTENGFTGKLETLGVKASLNGERYFLNRPTLEAGKAPVKAEIYEFGYWRKHPNLHGYIVQSFADGVDECQRIPLDEERLLLIMEAVKAKELPHTTGFFFGESEGTEEEAREDLTILQGALDWLRTKEKDIWRSVYYQASW
jgi:hypothetical protein